MCKQRIEAAAPRIQTLNPLVKIEKLSDESILQDTEKLKALKLDTVVSTKGSMDELVSSGSSVQVCDFNRPAAHPLPLYPDPAKSPLPRSRRQVLRVAVARAGRLVVRGPG